MAGGDARHSDVPRGRRLRRRSSGLVVLVLALAVVAHGLDLGPRLLGWDYPSPVTEPAEVAPPPGLTLPAPSRAGAVAGAALGGPVDPAAVRRAVGRLLEDPDLGPRVAVQVRGLADGATAFSSGPAQVTPASTMKLLTATGALASLGPDHRFSTSVVAGERSRDVVLVGGGDPLLARMPDGDAYPARADLATLARATARELRGLGRTRVRLGYDTSLFSGPAVNPAWRPSYVSEDVVSPISALWVDAGRVGADEVARSADPASSAAVVFARLLKKHGITVTGRPVPAPVQPEAATYATVRSAPLAQIVQWVLEASDNEGAEVLLRHVALAAGRPGSFDAGVDALREVLARLEVDTTGDRLLDGSGLARASSLSPDTLLAVLEVAASREHPELRPVVAGLPVAGFTGSLTYRFTTGEEAGLGRVQAKTGTLTGVHGLAGVVTDRDGTVLLFVAVADRVRLADTLDAREALDKVAAALAACSCSS